MERFLRIASFVGPTVTGDAYRQARHYKWGLKHWVLDRIVNTDYDDVSLAAILIVIIISLESLTPTSNYYEFCSTGWLRESTKWDKANIVSFLDGGGIGDVILPDDLMNVVLYYKRYLSLRMLEAVGKGYYIVVFSLITRGVEWWLP
ncbi:Six-bladed beta-propeller, TolB-like protein [Artemisia annua]|uniref:Six-bladed beta-propeller, TolB-like protein n=1 Tax=Artemisia annua TaxID=35608 RepID=A0A2U1MI16_ARTAN|nr:Six-bladed beta-propeller, TolB-like protein [Artemisia annua]